MANTKVVLNLPNINVVLRDPKVQAFADAQGAAIADSAGTGFEYVATPHKWTSRGYVRTTGYLGRRREARDKVLTRAVRRG